VLTFLKDDYGGVEFWIILVLILSITIALFNIDIQIRKIRSHQFEINEHLIMAMKGAAKRIDFYEASEGNIVIEEDYYDQLTSYIQEALLLGNNLEPLDVDDFGITGKIEIQELDVVPGGYDARSDHYFTDSGLVAVVEIPSKINILGIDYPFTYTLKPYAEIRR
jgi:hypothetical protein